MSGPRCRTCGHARDKHPHGTICMLTFCDVCDGWDPRWHDEPIEQPSQKTFRGTRLRDDTCLVVTVCRYNGHPSSWEHDLPPRLDLANHSPSGYEWGYLGSGPAQLSLAILAQCIADEDAVRLHQEFKTCYIAVLARGGNETWEIEEDAVVEWYQRQRSTR